MSRLESGLRKTQDNLRLSSLEKRLDSFSLNDIFYIEKFISGGKA